MLCGELTKNIKKLFAFCTIYRWNSRFLGPKTVNSVFFEMVKRKCAAGFASRGTPLNY